MTMKIAGVEIRGGRVLVVGMARSGLAAARLLVAEGAAVTATDTRPLEDVARLAGARFVPQADTCASGHDLVVISPGVPIDAGPLVRARSMGIPVIGEVDLASHFLLGPVLAVTGSNGKTTTTSLCYHILSECGIAAQVGGNIGTAACELTGTSQPDQWNVLEISSFQLEAVFRFRADIAICLNLTPDHLDRHGSMAAYARAKGRLFDLQNDAGHAVLNADDAVCRDYATRTKGHVTWFSTSRRVTPGCWHENGILYSDGEPFLDRSTIRLRGMHNVENILAATAAVRLAGAQLAGISRSIQTFPGVEHRIEFVRSVGGVDYFNDSKATNVDATLKALEAFPGRLWVILGGKDKGSDFRPLRGVIAAKAKAALLVGAAAQAIGAALEGTADLVESGTIAAAIEHAYRNARAGDTVLLAPACASFDQFDNYEHRGRVFKEIVRNLPSSIREESTS
jgi:UDP-N-acetylmuramoylalanine--D-glutamate ligase